MSDDHAPTWFRADLLLDLAAILERADDEHRMRGEPTYDQDIWRHPCGTPACALGHWAAAHPERGWRFKEQDTRAELTGVGLYQGDTWAMDAAETEFGLTLEEAWALFGPHGCGGAKSARGAAAYIREFVRRRAR